MTIDLKGFTKCTTEWQCQYNVSSVLLQDLSAAIFSQSCIM